MQEKTNECTNCMQKLKEKSSFQEIKIGLIPENWQVVRLGEIGKFQYGFTASATEDPIGPKFLRITDIKDEGRVSWEDVPFCKIHNDEFEKYHLKNGDILIARIGATTGKTCIVRGNPEAIFASYLIRLQVKNVAFPSFVYYLTKTSIYWAQINANKEGKLKKGVSASFLKTLEIPIPPLFEQQRIAKVLGIIQRAIEQQDKIIEAAKNLKKSLMQKLFTEGLRKEEQKETETGPIPKSWELVRLKDVGKIITGTTPSTKKKEYYGSGYMFISPADLGLSKYVYETSKSLSEEGLQVSRVLPKDTVLVTCIGSTIGKTGLTYAEGSATNQQINAIVCNSKVNPHFLYYWLSYNEDYIRSFEAKIAVPILNKSNFEKIRISLAPPFEQEQIARMLSTLDRKIGVEKKKKATLSKLFKTMLQELITGEIRLKDVEV